MKVDIYSTNELKGGAARAANRLFYSFKNTPEIDSRLIVGIKESSDPLVISPHPLFKTFFKWLPKLDKIITKLQITKNPIFHSTGFFGAISSNYINSSDADIIHLHWINSGLISIKTISKIKKPIVWTLHDSWAFCGAEHHPWKEDDKRFIDGYSTLNKHTNHWGLDLNKIVWKLKFQYPKSIHIVTPSTWLSDQAKQSMLLNEHNISVVPNPVDTNIFRPLDKINSKHTLKLPLEKKIILFGAFGSTFSTPKGGDLLLESLGILSNKYDNFADTHLCISIGGGKVGEEFYKGLIIKHYGHIENDEMLNLLFNVSDIVVVPSRIENLPQMATEAFSAGIPVAAFNIGGMSDIIDQGITGYMAKPYDCTELANGMNWILTLNEEERENIKVLCREKAISNWSYPVIIEKYKNIYENIINENF